MLSYNQVTLGTTAAKILDADASHKTTVVLVNAGSPTAFVGDNAVTTTNGMYLYAGAESMTLVLPPGASLYGVVASGSTTVSYFATA